MKLKPGFSQACGIRGRGSLEDFESRARNGWTWFWISCQNRSQLQGETVASSDVQETHVNEVSTLKLAYGSQTDKCGVSSYCVRPMEFYLLVVRWLVLFLEQTFDFGLLFFTISRDL